MTKLNSVEVLKTKRFVVRKSLIGKNVTFNFTNKKGVSITYNHDKVYKIMKSKLETLPCWEKYKSYTNSNCVPSFCRDLQTITE